MDINSIKGIRALKILNNYKGTNPYILTLKEQVEKSPNKALTETQYSYIVQNENYATRKYDKTVEITQLMGEILQVQERLGFIPKRVMVDYIIGETEKYFHVIGRLSTKQKPKMYMLTKVLIMDDLNFKLKEVNIDFERFDKRLMEVRGYTLLPHQKEAVKFLLERDGAILADDMGLAKTTSTIVAALETRLKRILIVCPSSIKVHWEREIETFSDNTSIINGRRYAQARFTIINPDILQNFHTLDSKVDPNDPPMYLSRELVNSKFDLIIIDEAHTLRNKKSIRGEIMSELCTKFGKPIVWLLSGTPVANRPKDFYNLLKLIRSPLADNFNHYMTRYCDGKQISKKLANGKTRRIWIANGASNLEELSNKSKHLVLRRLKEDVVDMPDKILSNIFLEMSESSRKEYERVWEEYLLERQRQQKRGNVEREMVELGLLRKFVAMEAIPSTVELAQQAIDDGRKVIIFTTFNDEQQELAEAFGDIAVCHNGSMSIDDKQNSVDMFQNNPKVKVFIGNVISAGSGITLTAGTLTIFNSFSWIPGDNEQAEDRSYRIGQKNDCNIYYMVFKDSVSEVVLNTIRKKRNMIDQIIDGNANRNINELILETVLNG